MIVVSMVLVIVGAVTLVIGVFFADESLTFVYISIASCLLAGLFLVIGIVRGRPSSKPVPASGGEAQPASWSGSSSAWQASRPGGATTVDRDTEETAPPSPAGRVQVVAQDEAEEEAPVRAEEDEDVTLVGEPSPEKRPAAAPAPAKKALGKRTRKAAGTRPLKRLGRKPAPSEEPAQPAPEEAPEEAPAPVAEPAAQKKATIKKGVGKKAARKKATKKATKKAATKKATKKAATKKATKKAATKKATKKAGAKKAARKATRKTAAKKAGAEPVPGHLEVAHPTKRAEFDEVMSDVSGVGPAKIDALFSHFGSIEILRNASVDEIAATKGVSKTVAQRIYDQLH